MTRPDGVSMRKAPASAPAGPVPPRPWTITAIAVLLVATGLAAVGAAISLFGLRGYLIDNAKKNQPVPPLTSTQVSARANAFRGFLTRDLTKHPQLSDAAVGARANDAQNWVTNNLPKSNVSTSDITDQASKMHDAVSSALQAVPGPTLGSTQVTNQANQLTATFRTNLTDLKNGQATPLTDAQIRDNASKAPKEYLLVNGVLLVALIFVALSVLRARYWSRWAVVGVWVLSTLGGAFAGISSVFYVGASMPVTLKIPVATAGLCMLAAVVLAFAPPSSRYYAALRPAGRPARRGLFAPRLPPPPRDATASRKSGATAAANGATSASRQSERSKAKQRASAEAVAKGAELARSRAKAASKSRRTGS